MSKSLAFSEISSVRELKFCSCRMNSRESVWEFIHFQWELAIWGSMAPLVTKHSATSMPLLGLKHYANKSWCESDAHMIHLIMQLDTAVALECWQETKSTVARRPPAIKSLSVWTAFLSSHWQNTWPEGKMETNNQNALYRCTLNETQPMFFLRLCDYTKTHIIDLLLQKK